MFLYVIRDLLANENGPVFEAVNDAVAQRSYLETLKKVIYPSDYRLIRFARIDKESLQVDFEHVEFDNSLIIATREDSNEK